MIEGLSGDRMLIALLIGIAFLVFLVLKTKVHSFLALIISTVLIGVIGGMPLATVKLANGQNFGIVNSIISGFGGTLGSEAIINGIGVMMGQIFDVTGAANRMAYTFLKVFGPRREEPALAITGFVVSIPIFCDSAFVVLSPIAKSISRVVKKSVIALGVSLAGGLVITHTLVPPTPGPLAVAGLYQLDIGAFLLMNLVLAIPMTIAIILYAKWYLSKKFYRMINEKGELVEYPYSEPDYSTSAHLGEGEDIPGTFEAFAPLALPILLIFINTLCVAMHVSGPVASFFIFLGQPIIAVGLGLLLAIFSLGRKLSKDRIIAEMEEGMKAAGLILLVTGGGGALGQIIKDSGLGVYAAGLLSEASVPLVILPLIISTAMRFIQGSGTVAMLTAASITAPIVLEAGANPMVCGFACCVGAVFMSYFNDSYFWVVNRMLGVSKVSEMIRVWSVPTLLAWCTGVVEVIILSIFFA